MADWSEIEFRGRRNARYAPFLASFLADALTAVDMAVFAAAAALAGARVEAGWGAREPNNLVQACLWCGICLIGAVSVRGPLQLVSSSSAARRSFIGRALRRFLLVAALFLAFSAVLFTIRLTIFSCLLHWSAIGITWVAISRLSISALLPRIATSGLFRKSIAIIGAEAARAHVVAEVADKANIIKVYDSVAVEGQEPLAFEQLSALGRDGAVDSVVVMADDGEDADLKSLIEKLRALPVDIAVSGQSGWITNSGPAFRFLGDPSLTLVADQPIRCRDLLLKTLLDKICACILLVLLSPFLAAIALGVAMGGPGPVLFRQIRQGWCGQNFTMLKFRTMRQPPDGGAWRTETMRDDPRCTAFGRILRKTSLDELPQLFNVMRGEMSLVGPRPHAPDLHGIDRAGREIVAEYAQRHRVRPGMTGWAQVHGVRGAAGCLMQMRRRVALDLYYIEHWSFWLDLVILVRTPFCLTGENAF